MKKQMSIIRAIKTYQVPGDIGNFDKDDYKTEDGGVGWKDHHPATYISGIGKIYLGMPKPFSRLGEFNDMTLHIFKDYEQYITFFKLPYNVPCWKFLDEYGNTLVRGLMPRINRPFICVVLGDCMDKINCVEISKEEAETMD